MIKQCILCKKDFITYVSRINVGKGKYCSKECSFKALIGRESSLKGIKLNEEQKSKLNLKGLELGRGWNKGLKGFRTGTEGHGFKKGMIPWNKGLEGYMSGEKHWSYGKKRLDITGDNNIEWKGDKVGYGALHDWVRNNLGSLLKCSICGKEDTNSRMFHWHNISGEYKRNLTDWLRVCVKCHKFIHKKI